MQRNARKPAVVRPGPGSVTSVGEGKEVRNVHCRKIPYRVGYNWDKGGRLKELRIRLLARKFLKIWIQNTFGRILPHKAKSHYRSVVLRRVFGGWRDEWWTSRREWSLTMRAQCHYRYYLCNVAFQSWRMFVSLNRKKKLKIQSAQSFADKQRLRLVWEQWGFFTEMRGLKNRMLESAAEQNALTTLRSAWSLWRTRLLQHRDLHTLEDRALKHRMLTLQSRTWHQWTERHTAAFCQKEKESKAALHFTIGLKRKTLQCWKTYVSFLQSKKSSQALAQRVRDLRLVMMCWGKWRSALHHKRSEEDRLHAAGHLAIRSTQRRALESWRAYVTLCRDKAERHKIARQHHHHHLQRVGLKGLSLNVTRNKMERLNNNMAVRHYHQTMTCRYWQLWQDRLEEAEDRSFQPLTEKALTKHRKSVYSSCFHHWREKLEEQRHMQELERRADVWFEHMLPRCFDSWVDFTLQRRLHKQRRHKADVFNQQRQYTLVFYTWRGRSEKHKEQMLSERMAVLHEERCHMQRAWNHWRQRTEQRVVEEEKEKASDGLYLHRLLRKTMTQWKDNSSEIRERRNKEQQACRWDDLRRMQCAVDKWKKFVESQKVKKSRLQQMERYHDVKLVKHAFMAWRKHHLQMSRVYSGAEELHRHRKQNFLRKVLCAWRENAVKLAEVRLTERQAQNHFQHCLKLKVFVAWKEVTACAVSKRHQQEEAVSKAQRSINKVRLLQSFRLWRKQTKDARRQRICMEKARQHHNSKLLTKALKAWDTHHDLYQKKKIMKRQGLLLLKLKLYQKYFEQWKVKLQRRQREAKQTERALWHWSLTLQAKVLYGWRLWVTEQRRKQEQAARAAQVYRDQLLREGVTCILTYAAHMNDLTTSLTQPSQEQKSRRLQRVVKRCAMRWKQRALCKPRKEREVPKKRVTFCLTSAGVQSVSLADAEEQEAEDEMLSKLSLSHGLRRQPRRCEELFASPVEMISQRPPASSSAEAAPPPQEGSHKASPCLRPADVPVTSEPRIPTKTQNQDVLLPPSAFMTAATENQFDPPFKDSSAYSASSEQTVEDDPTSALTGELLSIQLDMVTYQEDRKQLRAWQKLKEVLQSWLQTSGKDEQMERDAVCQELKELEERIGKTSTDLAKRKPGMLQHAERIQHLQSSLQAAGVSYLHQQREALERDRSVFTA